VKNSRIHKDAPETRVELPAAVLPAIQALVRASEPVAALSLPWKAKDDTAEDEKAVVTDADVCEALRSLAAAQVVVLSRSG